MRSIDPTARFLSQRLESLFQRLPDRWPWTALKRASDGIAGTVCVAIVVAALQRLGHHPLFDPGCKERGTHRLHRHDLRIGQARLGEAMAGPIFMD